MGSLEGSIGSIGGFCVGASIVIEHQRLSGLGYCFSASLPPFLSHISICVLNIFDKNPELFSTLRALCLDVDEKLRSLPEYTVLSNPHSPLKVISIRGKKNREMLDKVHSFVSDLLFKKTCLDDNSCVLCSVRRRKCM